MTIAEFKDLMQGLQAAVLAAAAIAAGVWALVSFRWLRVRDKARAEMRDLERRLQEQAVVDTSIAAFPMSGTMDKNWLVVEVTIKNVGNRNTRLLTKECPLRAVRLGATGEKEEDLLVADCSPELDYVLRVGNVIMFPYLVAIPGPGIYRVGHHVHLSASEVRVAEKEGQPPVGTYWGAEKYVVVSHSPQAP